MFGKNFSIFFTGFLLICTSCKNSKEPENKVNRSLEDSLKTVSDSIMDARRMHAMYQGQHVHNPGDNLAQVAHQDPERDRMIRKAIRDNRDLQLKVYEQQTAQMLQLIQEKRPNESDSTDVEISK